MGQACSLNPVQLEAIKYEWQECRQGFGHISLLGIIFSDPVADAAALRDPAPDIINRDAA